MISLRKTFSVSKRLTLNAALLFVVVFISSGCSILTDTFKIEFDSIIPFDFQNGTPRQCHVNATLRNDTKYRFDRVSFTIAALNVNVWSNANAEKKDVSVIDVPTDANSDCADLVKQINDNAKNVHILDCSITGMAEGDCQTLVRVSTSMNSSSIAMTNSLQAAGYEKQMGELKKALIEAKLDASEFRPYDDSRYFQYRVLMDYIAASASRRYRGFSYINHSIRDIRLINQTKESVKLQGEATVELISNEKKPLIYIVEISKGTSPCARVRDDSDCLFIPIPVLKELTDASDANGSRFREDPWLEDPHDRRKEVEKSVTPYRTISEPFIQNIKSQGLCDSASAGFNCHISAVDPIHDPISIIWTVDNKRLEVDFDVGLRNGKSGVRAKVSIENKDGMDVISREGDAFGIFGNIVLPLFKAFNVDPAAGVDAINKCHPKSDLQPGWISTEFNGTIVSCSLSYGPTSVRRRYRDFELFYTAR